MIGEKKIVRDCHYCEQAMCENTEGTVDCYVEDNCYFDHHVQDSKEEAENCEFFLAIATYFQNIKEMKGAEERRKCEEEFKSVLKRHWLNGTVAHRIIDEILAEYEEEQKRDR